MFAGKHGFITPRDLFRWAERGAAGYQALAEEGFALLGERLRSAEERALVQVGAVARCIWVAGQGRPALRGGLFVVRMTL